MIPMIGLIADVDGDEQLSMVNTYTRAIEGAGGLPVVLPYICDAATLDRFAEACDGYLFTGGPDVDPARYGEERRECCGPLMPLRDRLEFAVFERVYAKDRPILAICRGLQMVNVALGGTLYQDLPSEYGSRLAHRQSEGKLEPSHDVLVERGTPLFALLGRERTVGNSFHHQAVRIVAPTLRVMARAEDGVIEGLYAPDRTYLRAYQWHPERLVGFEACSRRLFRDFVSHCEGQTGLLQN